MAEVLEIENRAFEYAWTEAQFINCLRIQNVMGMVAEHEERVVGYMVYELNKTNLNVLNLAVSPSHEMKTVGSQLVEKMKGKLSRQRRCCISISVRETNLDALLFFKRQGFEAGAGAILKNQYEENDEDMIRLSYKYVEEPHEQS